MRKMRIWQWVSVVTLLLIPILGLTGMTASARASDGLVYAVMTDCVEIQKYNGDASSVEIPDKVEGLPVTAIRANAFYKCTFLESITLPDTLTGIESCAFYGCTSLTSIALPDTVKRIEEDAFYGCTSLASVTLSDSLTRIDFQAFYGCTSLTDITIPAAVTYVGWGAFEECTSLTSFAVDDANSVYASVDGVLFDKSMTTLLRYPRGKDATLYTVPSGVTHIEENAFLNCTSLTSVTLPDTLTDILWDAFHGCTSLETITIPGSVTNWGSGAFEDCTSLKSVEILDGATTVGSFAFYKCTSLENVVIPDSVTNIDWYAFGDCASLASIAFPRYVTNIGAGAFSGCSSLTSVTLPDSVTTIDYYAFADCVSLENITIPTSVTSIGHHAFAWCPTLGSIVIPNRITTIEANMFEGCCSLTSVTIPSSVTSIGQYAFSECSALKTIALPNSVETIGACAFASCDALKDITIPSSVTSIGNYVFKECSSLNAIVIPNSVISMGYSVFSDCTSLKSVTLPSGLASVGYNQFYDCRSLTAVTIPNGVTSIGGNAFRNCVSLTSITLPHGVTSISKYAFYDCSKLANVYYAGSKEDKKAIIIDGYNAQLTDAIWHFNGCDGNYTNVCDASCNTCGAVRTASHTYKTTVTKATLTENGSVVKRCAVCGKLASKYTVKSPQTFKLSATSYTYDGKVKAPTVTVKDTAGKTLKKGTHYTVTYASGRKNVGTYKVTVKMIGNYSGTKTLSFKINPIKISTCKLSLSATSYTYNGYAKTPSVKVKNANGTTLQKGTHYTVTYASGRKNVGTYKVTIKMKGNYSGTKTLTFKINPPKTSVAKLIAGTKAITVSITKKTSQVSGYQIQYATSKSFANATTKTVSSYTTTKYTLKSLKADKTYYVRVRTYKTLNGKKVYSDWSTAKSAKVK